MEVMKLKTTHCSLHALKASVGQQWWWLQAAQFKGFAGTKVCKIVWQNLVAQWWVVKLDIHLLQVVSDLMSNKSWPLSPSQVFMNLPATTRLGSGERAIRISTCCRLFLASSSSSNSKTTSSRTPAPGGIPPNVFLFSKMLALLVSGSLGRGSYVSISMTTA